MNRISTAFIAIISAAALTQIASAADLPRKAPAYVPPPAPAWTGFYIGGHLGGAWETNGSGSASDPLVTITFAPISRDFNASAFLAGGQIGYNYQFSPNWLVGVEADGSWTRLHASTTAAPVFFPNGTPFSATSVQFGSNVDWLVSLRARLGYVWGNNWMAYVTGGAAWARFKYSANFICPNVDCGALLSGLVAPGSGSSTDVTWVAGVGVQWRPTAQNWSIGAEYLYYGFNTTHNFTGAELDAGTGAQVSFGGCGGAVPCNLSYSIKDSNIQVARVRFDWKFGP